MISVLFPHRQQLPGKRGQSSPLHLHLGPRQTSLLTKSHFWLSLFRVRACPQRGHWPCPSCASHRSPEHTWTGRTSLSQSSGGSEAPLGAAEGELTAVWSKSLRRFHPLLTWWCLALCLQWDGRPPTVCHSDDQQLQLLTEQKEFQLFKVWERLHVFHFRFYVYPSVEVVVTVFWPLDGDSGSSGYASLCFYNALNESKTPSGLVHVITIV